MAGEKKGKGAKDAPKAAAGGNKPKGGAIGGRAKGGTGDKKGK